MVYKKEVVQEGQTQEQPINATIEISNLNEFKCLVSETTKKLKQIENFKFEVKTDK